MIFLALFFSSLFATAQEPVHWNNILEVSDKHEFYQNHEVINKPKDSWQGLFSLVYIDRDLKGLKDCVFYRVPGTEPGILKLKTISGIENCDQYLLSPGGKEVKGIKSLSYAIFEKEVKLDFNRTDFKSEKWQAFLQTSFKKPRPEMDMSSSEFKSPKLIFLGPKSIVKTEERKEVLKLNSLCHDINEDCMETSPSICSQCPMGWYEIPNGCAQGPKYCGVLECGGKNQPACRRGMKWQKSQGPFDCRTNSSFAYCSKGLAIQCEGKKAFCR